VVGNPSPEANEADVRFSASIMDIRRKGNLDDYTGDLQGVTAARVTDRDVASSEAEPSTVQDFDFSATIPCAATPDTAVGSTCSISTTFNALMPGAVTEGNRAIWELGQVQVFDGGPDGDVGTQPNMLFATQGIFVP
jgi:hypothetical protein